MENVRPASNLSTSSKTQTESRQLIDADIQDLLKNSPTSNIAQEFLEQCWSNNQWIACSCSPETYLTVRKTSNFFVLVRVTSRGTHTKDCHFSEENMPIYRNKLAERITSHNLSFHRPKSTKSEKHHVSSPISINGQISEASKLARFMFTLYDDSDLNKVPLSGIKPNLKTQYRLIRQVAARFTIAGQTGNNAIFSHPGDIKKAKQYLIERKWPQGSIPQVLLFFTVDAIDGRKMLIKVGKQNYQLTSQSKIEYFYDNGSPPYNVLMTLALREHSEAPEILRACALPILEKSWLLPVKNKLVRKFIRSMLAMSREYETYDAAIFIPFFPKLFRDISVRPDFSIEREGQAIAVFYFISKQDDNYTARISEIDFLRSHKITVTVFDMDKVRTDPEKDAWFAAKVFFDKHVKSYELKHKTPRKDKIIKDQNSDPIDLLA